jgi:hypothetical protein
MANLSKILILALFLSSCSLTSYYVEPVYEDHPHTTEVYYYGVDVYFGYYSGFYYYYGVPHFYPWWYYYQFIPPYHFHTHTHVYVQCDNGYYVYGHRGPLFHNTGPDCPNNQGKFIPTIKPKNNIDKSYVFPRDWKSSNSTRDNKQNNVKYNINKINYNRTFNQSYNINSNNKINKGNNGSTRPNKTRINQKKKR